MMAVSLSDEILCDHVVVTEAGAPRELSIDEFFRLPLARRLELVIAGAVKFFSSDTEVEPRVALAALRKRRAF